MREQKWHTASHHAVERRMCALSYFFLSFLWLPNAPIQWEWLSICCMNQWIANRNVILHTSKTWTKYVRNTKRDFIKRANTDGMWYRDNRKTKYYVLKNKSNYTANTTRRKYRKIFELNECSEQLRKCYLLTHSQCWAGINECFVRKLEKKIAD